MSTQTNKTLIENYFKAANIGDENEILSFLSDDFQFESMLKKPAMFNFSWDREAFAAAPKNMAAQMKSPLKIWIVGMIAEGDKIAVQAESMGEMSDGKIYNNAYHFLYTLRDNKICNAKEYSCSFTANDCFGHWDIA